MHIHLPYLAKRLAQLAARTEDELAKKKMSMNLGFDAAFCDVQIEWGIS